jgi:MoaA/NifB/PqqE/SkfB family radical SAM enzyme
MYKISKRGVIYPTMVCNIKCEFCYYRYLKNKTHEDFGAIKLRLDKFRNYYNLEYVDITGGEPTVYPYIKEMVVYCNKIGLKPTIITNAQKPEVFPELINLGLEDLLISIHGLEEEHNEMVGTPNAFKNIMKTIEILKKLNFSFRTNTTITKRNYKNLLKIAELFKQIKPRIVNFIIFNPHEGTLWATKINVKFQPKHSEIAPYLKEAIDYLMQNNIWVNVRYFPLCFMVGYEKHVCNFHQWQYDPYEWEYTSSLDLSKEEIEKYVKEANKLHIYGNDDKEKLYNYLAKRQILGLGITYKSLVEKIYYRIVKLQFKKKHRGNIFTEKCKDCINYFICDGIYPQYAKNFGLDEIMPVKGNIYIRDPLYYRSQDTRWAELKNTKL